MPSVCVQVVSLAMTSFDSPLLPDMVTGFEDASPAAQLATPDSGPCSAPSSLGQTCSFYLLRMALWPCRVSLPSPCGCEQVLSHRIPFPWSVLRRSLKPPASELSPIYNMIASVPTALSSPFGWQCLLRGLCQGGESLGQLHLSCVCSRGLSCSGCHHSPVCSSIPGQDPARNMPTRGAIRSSSQSQNCRPRGAVVLGPGILKLSWRPQLRSLSA